MIVLNMQDARPIYSQIVDGVKEQVLKGFLKEGDTLPSVRELASVLVVTPNTVSKAYQELERQGVIAGVRGKGYFIQAPNTIKGERERREILEKQVKQVCIEWAYVDGNKERLKAYIDTVYDEIYDAIEGR